MSNIYEAEKTGRASFITTGRPILGHQAQTSDTSNIFSVLIPILTNVHSKTILLTLGS